MMLLGESVNFCREAECEAIYGLQMGIIII